MGAMMPGQGSEAGRLRAMDALRDRLRAEYPDAAIIRTPWGWSGRDRLRRELQAETLDELEPLLKAAWPGPGTSE